MTHFGAVAIPVDHPALPGHFPGDPIVPGVLLLAEIFALLAVAHSGRRAERLLQVKFLRPVRPEQNLIIVSQEMTGGRIGFEGMVDKACALKGVVMMASS